MPLAKTLGERAADGSDAHMDHARRQTLDDTSGTQGHLLEGLLIESPSHEGIDTAGCRDTVRRLRALRRERPGPSWARLVDRDLVAGFQKAGDPSNPFTSESYEADSHAGSPNGSTRATPIRE